MRDRDEWFWLLHEDSQPAPGSLRAEKRREDALRALGDEVVRLTWDELANPRLVRHKILAAIARAEAANRPTA